MTITPQPADDVREVPLTRGLVALVDAGDFDAVLSAGKWHATPGRHTFYARHGYWRDGKSGSVQMHTFLTGWPFVDHANGNGLDNRRSNLRQSTHAQNMANSRLNKNNTSGFRGVSRNGSSWGAQIRLGGRPTYLGTHDTPQSAARAYDAAALEHFGEFAQPNFPLERHTA